MTGLSFGHGRHPKHQVYIRQPAGVLIVADAGSVHEACSDPACNIPFAHASHPLVDKQLVTGSRASKPGIAHDARGALLSVRAAGGNLWASTGGQMVRGCAVLSSIVLLDASEQVPELLQPTDAPDWKAPAGCQHPAQYNPNDKNRWVMIPAQHLSSRNGEPSEQNWKEYGQPLNSASGHKAY